VQPLRARRRLPGAPRSRSQRASSVGALTPLLVASWSGHDAHVSQDAGAPQPAAPAGVSARGR
jgi:hypothetical protein